MRGALTELRQYGPPDADGYQGTRDDLIQRRALEAVLAYWAPSGANNPTSGVYSGRIIEAFGIWIWDARPYPAWPGRADLWSDGDLYPLGHWLNGKVGLADLAALVAERCRRVGFAAYDVSALIGVLTGFLRDRPMSPRAEIEALASAYFRCGRNGRRDPLHSARAVLGRDADLA